MSDEIRYLDFEVAVGKEGDKYFVRVTSGNNKANIRFANPFNEDKRKVVRSTLTAAALRSTSGKRKPRMRSAAAPEVREMKDFGALLFQEAFKGAVGECYRKCQAEGDQQRQGMRLRLSLDSTLDDLPWEFLCQQDDFLALNPRSPIVRYIQGASPCSLVKVEYPLQVLVVIAKPSDEVPLDTSAEKESITEALKPLEQQGLVRLTFIEGPNTWEHMMDAFLPNRTHILHFIGHGTFDDKNGEGVLVMEDDEGKAMMIDSERLRVLVQGKSRLALIVLNSCLGTQGDNAQPFSSVAAGLVKSGVPAVIAMQFEISDEAAREIAETFYTSLALNMPVDAALTEARRRIFLSDRNSLEWATPILYMQVPDGQLFEFKEPRPRSEPSKQVDSDAFEVNATKRYREGEAAMGRGDWEEAVTAFRGAMVYVPNYRDAAEKLSICAKRANAVTLYHQAEGLVATKDYDRADALLDQASKADPALDVKGLRKTIDCGQRYLRAIAELEQGNQPAGAELLREVIRLRPDFEDAAARLDDVAAGGTGLMREPALMPVENSLMPPPGPPVTQGSFDVPELRAGWDRLNKWWKAKPTPPQTAGPPASCFSWRRYEVANPNLRQLAEEIRLYFHRNECEHQIFQQESGWVVQGKKMGKWRGWLGMEQAATVLIEQADDGMKVSIGGAKWIDKGAGAATGLLLGFTWFTS